MKKFLSSLLIAIQIANKKYLYFNNKHTTYKASRFLSFNQKIKG
jgi:hypothetical protein